MSCNWLEERGWIFYSFSFHQCPMCLLLQQTVGVGGVVVVGCLVSVLWGEMLICCAFTRRLCSFVSCLQWIVNKQRLLSLQRRDGWLVSVLVSAAVSAIPIPNRYHWYRPDTDTEYWYRSKPTNLHCNVSLMCGPSVIAESLVMSYGLVCCSWLQ